jgi:soluble lytic murein transglycosylase-like protein
MIGIAMSRREDMSCMLTEDHKRIVRRVHLLHLKIHLLFGLLLGITLYAPFHYMFERDLLQEAIQTLRSEYCSIKMRHQILDTLRARPLTIRQAMDIADAVIQQKNVPVEVAFGIMKQESEFTPEAVSKKGAKGLMQVMPVVWKSYSPSHFKNPTDPVLNVHVGTIYLADLYHRFGDWREVFRAYYAGPDNYNNRKYDWYANAVVKKAADFSRDFQN